MRKDTPVNAQLPEWKKEVAEKVKAYGERKKRLTTPPYPLKQNGEPKPQHVPAKPPAISFSDEPDINPSNPPVAHHLETKPVNNPSNENSEPAAEIWTQDVQGFANLEFPKSFEAEETISSTGPYVIRRIFAGAIDHTILLIVAGILFYGVSFVIGKSVEQVIQIYGKESLSFVLLLHFIYYLYFFRASRQTPGMLFVSLELRDPAISVIPLSKLILRWFAFIFLNVFNLLPAAFGKKFLLLDQLSGTEMRSFK